MELRVRFTGSLMIAAMLAGWIPLSAGEVVDVAPPPSSRFPAKWYPPTSEVGIYNCPGEGRAVCRRDA